MTSDKRIRPSRNPRYTIEAQTLYPVNRVPHAVSCCTVESDNTVSRRIQGWRFAVVGEQSQNIQRGWTDCAVTFGSDFLASLH